MKKRRKKSDHVKTQEKIWELARKITFERYGKFCYTCGRGELVGANCHLGHMWAKGSLGASLKYDLRILRPQCYDCNINKGGMGAIFYRNMLLKEGEDYMARLEADLVQDKRGLKKASLFYPMLLEEYKVLWEKIQKKQSKSWSRLG